jgi:SAM-dependent methyltransferase
MTAGGDDPNREQVAYWNSDAAARWVAFQAQIDALLAPITRAVLDRAAIAPGACVIDIGCGCGTTTQEIARRAGPAGTVLGIDVSAAMLAHARARLDPACTQVAFRLADASTHAFASRAADIAFSRFGVMFFADPVRAFANVRGALRPGGRLVFVCWQAPDANEWVRLPMKAALAHLPPLEPTAPDAPGPFALAGPDRVRRILEDAGFTRVAIDGLCRDLEVAGSLDDIVAFYRDIGPAARLLREAPPASREGALRAMRDALASRHDGGAVRLGSASWLVGATAA